MSLPSRFYPEIAAGGYSRVDGSIELYTRIRALLRPDTEVLDFGAGRGWAVVDDPNPTRSRLANLRGACAKVVGVDIDPVVRENPGLDEAVVIQQGQPLPFAASSFDLVVSDHVFEHNDDPESVAAEIDRVLRPEGWICARTPNRNGCIAWGAARAAARRRLPDSLPPKHPRHLAAALSRWSLPSLHLPLQYGASVRRELALTVVHAWSWSRVAPEALCATWLIFMQKRQSLHGSQA